MLFSLHEIIKYKHVRLYATEQHHHRNKIIYKYENLYKYRSIAWNWNSYPCVCFLTLGIITCTRWIFVAASWLVLVLLLLLLLLLYNSGCWCFKHIYIYSYYTYVPRLSNNYFYFIISRYSFCSLSDVHIYFS